MRPSEPPVDAVRELAIKERVCVRPLIRRVIDTETGEAALVALPCQSTRESRCPSCAAKARALRMTQCLDGWHLEEEPELRRPAPTPRTAGRRTGREDEEPDRATRSTRRRADAPDLPRRPQEDRTIGQVFEAPDGRTYRPSMFVTLTLPGYGRIVPGAGVPRDPARYDYRRAALDALHFPRLLDRWFQNLRRCAGYKVQYFGAVEGQRRLAPHFHVALRGAIPRAIDQGGHHAPPTTRSGGRRSSTPVYVDERPGVGRPRLPRPDHRAAAADLGRRPRPLDDDEDAAAEHVMRFGPQLDVKGLLAGTPDADRSVRYLTKYLTKAVGETYAGEAADAAYEAHIDRLHDEVRWLPCSPDCANWLRFGVQPRNAGPGLVPGRCPSKAHDREHLGVGGRRVLVSRGWSGKTLRRPQGRPRRRGARGARGRGHRGRVGSTDGRRGHLGDGEARFVWSAVVCHGGTSAAVLMETVLERRRWREQYEHAKTLAGSQTRLWIVVRQPSGHRR